MSIKFKIPVTWEVYGVIEVEAETLQKAVEIFDDFEMNKEGYPLPLDNEYVDGSFSRELDFENIELLNKNENENEL